MTVSRPVLLVHGGAGTIREADRPAYLAGLQEALDHAWKPLAGGGSALVTVIEAVRTMEDNPDAFNAGRGGAPSRDGVVECDAAVMSGADRSCGAVAALTVAKNPILVADALRRESPHVMLVAEGANVLVPEPIDNRELLTERSLAALERWRQRDSEPLGSATVGAVALDADGNLAAATSTGGVLGKWPGRIGDSALIGSGTYADAHIAVSCTGTGEAFIRAVTAKTLACRVEAGMALSRAVRVALADIFSLEGNGGLIAVTSEGELCLGFNSPHMAYGFKTETRICTDIGPSPKVFKL